MRMVRFESNGGVAQGSRLFDIETGAGIHGIRRMVATVELDNFNIVEAEFVAAEIQVDGRLRACTIDPETGGKREIAKIVWADGGEWEP